MFSYENNTVNVCSSDFADWRKQIKDFSYFNENRAGLKYILCINDESLFALALKSDNWSVLFTLSGTIRN